MKLSTKELKFTIAAVRFQADHFERICDDETADEDDRADAGNDMMLLREIAAGFEAELKRVLADPDAH